MGMLQEYIQENKTLKSENSQLEKFREKVRQQHEVLTRENEKLARKLEQVLRSQTGGPIVAVNNNPEYVVVEEPLQQQQQRVFLQPKAFIQNQPQTKILPRIEKKTNYAPVEVVSVRSTSPVRSNRSSPKKIYVTQAHSDPGGEFSSPSNGIVE